MGFKPVLQAEKPWTIKVGKSFGILRCFFVKGPFAIDSYISVSVKITVFWYLLLNSGDNYHITLKQNIEY